MAPQAQAKSSRVAIVAEVSGDVTVRKAGGSKSYTVYEDMSLNEGDLVSTGSGASLVLRTADHDDEITVGENAEVSISDLTNQGGGKTSKFKLWAGSAWTKVKSLVGSEDDFEIETPTAVMGVRGTYLYTSVNPVTGQTTMLVAAGVVSATTVTSYDAGNADKPNQERQHVTVYPSQQINLDSRTGVSDLRVNVDYVNPEEIVSSAPPEVIQALLNNIQGLQQENDQIKQKLKQGSMQFDPSGILKINNNDDLNKVTQNFDALVPNLAKAAVDSRKLSEKAIDEANQKIQNEQRKIDLNNVPPIDRSAGLDPEVAQLKQQQQASEFNKAALEMQQLAQMQQSLGEMLDKLMAEKQKIDEANQKALEAANQSAMAQYMSQLSGEQLQRFLDSAAANSAPQGGGTTASGGSGGGGGSHSSLKQPPSPTVTSPQQAATGFNPAVVQARAPEDTELRIYNGSELLASAPGAGDRDVALTLKTLPEGTYNLTVVAVRSGMTSSPVYLPAITISDAPILISPQTDLATNTPIIVVKAPIDTKVKVMRQGVTIAEAAGQGDQEVSIPLTGFMGGVIVLDDLTIVTDRGGLLSAPVAVPKITVDQSMAIFLQSVTRQNNAVTANLAMKHFVKPNAFYAVEAHLVYDNRLSYKGDGTVVRSSDTVFGSRSQSVERLMQSAGAAESELIYAASAFGADSGAIEVPGEQALVSIPLALSGSDVNSLNVKLIYYKVVDRTGKVIAEVNLASQPDALPVK
ncbi:FecR domain-containing protein [Paenibacillus doosanensis]|uniref:FecR domain-containing protein n=1 Tax=Paenibacillus doosanensis TaxID=1229154 RepID=UPI0021801CE6|nr:FecR domain-containing protein [Paenibacillus doosanensis]MCS7460132.1 FecR domain-containing protein [Paenibacillus doosanensis]